LQLQKLWESVENPLLYYENNVNGFGLCLPFYELQQNQKLIYI
jgi:UDP-glucose 4-epimerase